MLKKTILAILATTVVVGLAACSSDATVVSSNLSKAADNFEINRRIVFYNGITGEYMLTVEGACSLGSGTSTNSLTVTCKTGPNEYKKHFLGLSDNVTYFSEQVEGANASAYHYRVIFKPQQILPDIDFRGDITALPIPTVNR
jgi:hypothetical protein